MSLAFARVPVNSRCVRNFVCARRVACALRVVGVWCVLTQLLLPQEHEGEAKWYDYPRDLTDDEEEGSGDEEDEEDDH